MFAHIQLDNYFIHEFQVKANPDYDKKAKNSGAKVAFKRFIRSHRNNPNKYLVDILVSIQPITGQNKKYCPYFINVGVHGYFHFEKKPKTEKEKKNLLGMNAPAILYGLIRGQVAQMTAMGPYGRYILPAISLLEMEKEREGKEQKKKS